MILKYCELLEELRFHLKMLDEETIDKDDFVNAINEIYTDYKVISDNWFERQNKTES